jgi:hypothetical protein
MLAPARIAPSSFAAACAAVAMFAGCGDSGPSRTDYVKRADTICADGQDRIQSIQSQPATSAKAAAAQAGALETEFTTELAKLHEIDPPSDLRDQYGAYLKAREGAIAIVKQLERAARQNKPQDYVNANATLAKTASARYDLARKAGLRICSRPQSLPGAPSGSG